MPPRTRKDADPAPDQTEPAEAPAEQAADPEDVPVHVAWARVMRDVGAISKAQRNTQQGFNFRGIDDVINTVGPVLRRHGVFLTPKILEIREERYATDRGTAMHAMMPTIRYTVHGPDGGTFDMEAIGESADAGDKAATKAQSVAYRTVLLQSLCIPTDERDPDADAHQRAADGARQGATTDHRNGGQVTRPADQQARPRDPRQPAWDAILAAGQQNRLSADEIRADFRGRMGKEIDGPDTTLDDLNLYRQHMTTPPAAPSADGAAPTEGEPQW